MLETTLKIVSRTPLMVLKIVAIPPAPYAPLPNTENISFNASNIGPNKLKNNLIGNVITL